MFSPTQLFAPVTCLVYQTFFVDANRSLRDDTSPLEPPQGGIWETRYFLFSFALIGNDKLKTDDEVSSTDLSFDRF
ncbi:hypothetical protein Q31b_49870 [Novipirellula aureliae]|uniref:Uncharacterized protein n=1 Tax=Novipirellula aureliae TaxID=2527966 RepID=A0A5C6DKG3_9BACT|nr:hypothetical protein Q31b_49870 [Novipirellula aureliae]